MKVLFLVALVTILGVDGQDPPRPSGAPSPPRHKFFEILRCIVEKYCRRESPACMERMEECAREILSQNKPEQDVMKNTFQSCARENNVPFDDDTKPNQPPSHDHTYEERCAIMECIMKKNKTFLPFVECINRGSDESRAAKYKRLH